MGAVMRGDILTDRPLVDMSRSIRCPHCGQMHEATIAVCPVTGVPMRNTRSHPSGVASVKPGAPKAPGPPAQQLVVPRPPQQHAGQMDNTSTPVGPPPRSARRALIGQVVDGKYKVRAVLGEGG